MTSDLWQLYRGEGSAWVEVELSGASMGATLPAGSRLRVACPSRYVPGDVVLMSTARPHRFIVHRLLGYWPGRGWLAAGDAAPTPDPWLQPDQMLGKVIAVNDEDFAVNWRQRLVSLGRFSWWAITGALGWR